VLRLRRFIAGLVARMGLLRYGGPADFGLSLPPGCTDWCAGTVDNQAVVDGQAERLSGLDEAPGDGNLFLGRVTRGMAVHHDILGLFGMGGFPRNSAV
jgi:hypothetical protein